MNRVLSAALIGATAALLVVDGQAAIVTGTVARAISGDAFELKPESPAVLGRKLPPPVRVSIAAIDAPDEGQPFAQEARNHLASLIVGKVVSVDTKKNDTKGDAVGKVLVGGTDVGLQMVRAGFAWYARGQAGTLALEDQGYYLSAEGSARRDLAGLWADRNPTAPWIFRRSKPRPVK